METYPRPVEIVREFVTPKECDVLLTWANEEYALGTLGHDWGFRQTKYLSRTPDEFWSLRKRVATHLRVDDVAEPGFPNALSTVGAGTVFSRHVDGLSELLQGYRHVRANAFLQLPEIGGEPIVDDIEYEVAVGDLIIFTADYAVHTYNRVGGPIRRVLCSFGFLIPRGCWLCGNEALSV